jgi:hypothetical protein
MLELSNESKNRLIIFLLILLFFSLLGINILSQAGFGLQEIIDSILPFFMQLFGIFGMATGKAINLTSDVAAEGTKSGIDVVDGSIQSVGKTLQKVSALSLLSGNKSRSDNIKSDDSNSNIQNNISSNKAKWCLVGEYEGKRGCIQIDKSDECISNQTFPNEKICLNPAKSDMKHFHQLEEHNN